MAHTQPHPLVKYFIAVLFSDVNGLAVAKKAICGLYGAIDFDGPDHAFDATDYYEFEMGAPLFRRLISIEKLASPTLLVDMKLACNEVEDTLAVDGKRVVNCDAGYLDHNKVLLASAKEAGQKIYLDKGIYADLAGRYRAGRYQPFEWSFLDFKDGRYDADLLAIRNLYLKQKKEFQVS